VNSCSTAARRLEGPVAGGKYAFNTYAGKIEIFRRQLHPEMGAGEVGAMKLDEKPVGKSR